MRPRPLRPLAAALLVAAAGLAVPAAVTAPPAAASTACSTVTVVVDRGTLGGGATTRCTSGNPSSGLAALSQSGHSYTLVQTEPFVCRIDGAPASDPCTRTPPSNAYWSYWHARPGGSWTYASTGAYAYDPAPGSVEGWAFGAGTPPSTRPPAPRPAPAPTTAAPRPSATVGSSGGGTGSRTTARHSSATRSGTPRPTTSVLGTKSATTPAPATSPTGPTATAATADASSPNSSTGAPLAGAGPPPGSGRIPPPLLGLGGLVLVGGLGGAAWWRARREAGDP